MCVKSVIMDNKKFRCMLWKTCKEGICSHRKIHTSYGKCATMGCTYMENIDIYDIVCIPINENIIDVDELFKDIEL